MKLKNIFAAIISCSLFLQTPLCHASVLGDALTLLKNKLTDLSNALARKTTDKTSLDKLIALSTPDDPKNLKVKELIEELARLNEKKLIEYTQKIEEFLSPKNLNTFDAKSYKYRKAYIEKILNETIPAQKHTQVKELAQENKRQILRLTSEDQMDTWRCGYFTAFNGALAFKQALLGKNLEKDTPVELNDEKKLFANELKMILDNFTYLDDIIEKFPVEKQAELKEELAHIEKNTIKIKLNKLIKDLDILKKLYNLPLNELKAKLTSKEIKKELSTFSKTRFNQALDGTLIPTGKKDPIGKDTKHRQKIIAVWKETSRKVLQQQKEYVNNLLKNFIPKLESTNDPLVKQKVSDLGYFYESLRLGLWPNIDLLYEDYRYLKSTDVGMLFHIFLLYYKQDITTQYWHQHKTFELKKLTYMDYSYCFSTFNASTKAFVRFTIYTWLNVINFQKYGLPQVIAINENKHWFIGLMTVNGLFIIDSQNTDHSNKEWIKTLYDLYTGKENDELKNIMNKNIDSPQNITQLLRHLAKPKIITNQNGEPLTW